MKKMNPVVHFEMPAKDKKRVAKFYSEVFGWGMQEMGAEMGNYVVATTTPTDPKTTRPTTPGAINGGFFDYSDKPGFDKPSVVIAVDNLEESMEMVKKAGGKINGEPMDIPGVGLYVSFEDSEGNRVGILQPKM
jgi:hypothetical protein